MSCQQVPKRKRWSRLDPGKIYTPALPGKEVAYSTARVSDVAPVLARMGDGIAAAAAATGGLGRRRGQRGNPQLCPPGRHPGAERGGRQVPMKKLRNSGKN